MRICASLCFILSLLATAEPASAAAEPDRAAAEARPRTLNVVVWNVQALFSVDGVTARQAELKRFSQELAPDILILDEVTSLDVVRQVASTMGLTGYHAACSDFAQNDDGGYGALEVGILSRYPLAGVVEFDPTPDNTGGAGEPAEKRLERTALPGIEAVNVTRGFLTADIRELGLTVIATHLKSSRGLGGAADHANARQREFVAAAIAEFAAGKLAANRNATILLGGDLNVGETDRIKNGCRLEEDRYDAATGDLYDDTHALLTSGIVDGLHLASLTRDVGETYDSDEFPGTGPIDCLYVTGAQSGDFTLARKGAHTYGSDHFPVRSRFLFSGTAPEPAAPANAGVAARSPGAHIAALLANPAGRDEGQEYVELANDGRETVDLSGWTLRDRAEHTVAPAGRIGPGENRRVLLAAGQLPLNNGGDTIELLGGDGAVVHRVKYYGSQAGPGKVIRFGESQ